MSVEDLSRGELSGGIRPEGNFPRGICLEDLSWGDLSGGIFRGEFFWQKCPGWNCHGGFVLGELSRGFVLRVFIQGLLSVGNCPGGFVQGEMSRENSPREIVWGICLSGIYWGICLLGFSRGICPTRGIFQGMICPFTIEAPRIETNAILQHKSYTLVPLIR
jgi:hypothetical protein